MKLFDLMRYLKMLGVVTSKTDEVTGGLRTSAFAGAATYIPFGDSRVANGSASDIAPSTIVDSVRSPHVHVQALMQGRMVQLRNAGIGGNTTTQMLARVQADVIAYAPGWCLLEGPVNDITAISSAAGCDAALALAKSNVIEIYKACSAAGIRFATSTISPWTSSPTWTGYQRGTHAAYNRWVKAWAKSCSIPCADVYETNASAATGLFVSGAAYDVQGHYSDYGAYLAATAWVKVLTPVIEQNSLFSSSPGSLDNLIYDGGGGWTVGASLPATWTGTGTSITGQVNSVVARTDGVQGSLLQMTGTASAQGANMVISRAQDYLGSAWIANSAAFGLGRRMLANDGNQYAVTTAGTTGATQPTWNSVVGDTTADGSVVWTRVENFKPGDSVFAEVEVFLSGISGGNLGVQPQFIMQHVGGGGNLVACNTSDQASRVAPYPAGYYVLRSREYVIAAGCSGMIANVRAYLDNGVTATLQVGRVNYKHVTPVI